MGKSGEKQKRSFFSHKDKHQNQTQNKPMLDGKDLEKGGDPTGFVPPDGGWGWIVCLTSLWANGTVFGIINTFGIIYVQMREQYAKEEASVVEFVGNTTATDSQDVSLKTAFIGSMCTGVTFLMCTVSSILSDRIGIRPTAMTGAVLATIGLVSSMFVKQMELLYLTYGLLLGIGSSMVYSPSLVILGHYFKERMGLVNGIVSFGSAIFTIGLTRILPFLLRTVGIKYTFLFLSGLHFMLILFSFSWKPIFHKEEHMAHLTLSTESVYEHCNNCCTWTKKFLNVKIWRNKAYVIWVGSLGVALFGYFVPFFHLPKHIEDTFPGEDGSLLILCLSITSGVSRIVFGKLADFKCVSRIRMQQLAFAVLGISTLCMPFSASFGGLIAISLVMGVCDGIFVCLLGPIAFDIVGPAAASQAIGFLLGTFSIPFTVGPPVAGFLYDHLGDYRVAFHVAGVPPILGAILMFFIPRVKQSFPPVTDTMEFASISNTDIFNQRNVHQSTDSRNGAPSGPVTELQLIRSNDLLYLGANKNITANGIEPPGDKTVEPDTKLSNGVQRVGDQSDSLADKQESVEENSEREPMLPEAEKQEVNENKNSDVVEKTDSEGLSSRESTLLQEMEKYLESNNIPVDNVK